MHETGHSKLVHWDNPEGWDGEGVGGSFGMGDTGTPNSCQCMAILKKNPPQYCKLISLKLK